MRHKMFKSTLALLAVTTVVLGSCGARKANNGADVSDKVTVTTFAGTTGEAGSKDGQGPQARFSGPCAIACDKNGNLFVADRDNHCIRKITPQGLVSTVAGVPGQKGYADGAGNSALFQLPMGIAVDGNGTLYVADVLNNCIRKITPDGTVSTLAGKPDMPTELVDGSGSGAQLDHPYEIVLDTKNNLFIAQPNAIRKITPQGVVTTVVAVLPNRGFTDGPLKEAKFETIESLAIDASDNLYVTQMNRTFAIRKISTAGIVSTYFEVPDKNQQDTAGKKDTVLTIHEPCAMVFDPSGNLYTGDLTNHCIYKITPDGKSVLYAGKPIFYKYGSPGNGESAIDGKGNNATFNFIRGMAVDHAGNIYVTDFQNQIIRKITH